MDIGSMNRRITIQKHTTAVDAIGNHTSEWSDFHSCFSYVNLSSGREYGSAPDTVSEDTLVFTVRWCRKLSGINSKEYRIVYGGQDYDITIVDDVQFRHEKLKLTAKRVERRSTSG
jgi:SPP1 family predicted phage head-tail adaptor